VTGQGCLEGSGTDRQGWRASAGCLARRFRPVFLFLSFLSPRLLWDDEKYPRGSRGSAYFSQNARWAPLRAVIHKGNLETGSASFGTRQYVASARICAPYAVRAASHAKQQRHTANFSLPLHRSCAHLYARLLNRLQYLSSPLPAFVCVHFPRASHAQASLAH
jgi:hypothetical protein